MCRRDRQAAMKPPIGAEGGDMWVRYLVAAAGGVLACGLPLWPIPYSKVSLPGNPSATAWLVLGSAAGLLAGYLIRPRWMPAVAAVAVGFGLAVLGRVVVETTGDPTRHNLWPFEVVIAGVIGLAAGAIGVTIARLLQRAGLGG
jgi:hypothetical protein